MPNTVPRLLFAVLFAVSAAGVSAAHKLPARAPAPPLKASAAVRRWMRNMTPRDEIAQLIFVSFHGQSLHARSADYRKYVRLVQDMRIGGLILNNVSNGRTIQKAEPYQVGAFLNRMQRLARVPLLVAGDFERGASMRLDGTTVFPHAMAFGATGDPAFARYEGEVTAREGRAVGVPWILYPVADVNNNPDNPIINIRSFGEDPQEVARFVAAFIEGAHADRKNLALATAKHFPGHGDTSVDTHVNLATIPADRPRLERLELVPFKAAIAAGVDSIMTAHLAVPAISPPNLPATLSPAILTGLLRNELGFKGLVVTDALEMGGIAQGFSTGDACVRALEAGADALLMPTDSDAALRAVVAAEQSGRLTRRRIRESVARILAAKEKVGLDRKRFVDLEAMGDVLDSPEANQKAQEIADRAVTLVRNNGGLVPLAAPEHACFVVLPETRFSTEGLAFAAEVRKRLPGASLTNLDPSLPRPQVDDAIGRLGGCQQFAVAAFATVTVSRGSVGLAGEQPHAVEALLGSGKPVIMVALGSPYLLRNFPNVPAYLATFSNVPPSEAAAVRALWGEIAITGHLPVTIPDLARYGEGIQTTVTRPAPAGSLTDGGH